MVSALKNKAGKAIECDTVGGDATLHGVTREGLEQRAGRSEGVSHADNWGKGLLDRLSRAKGLGWECAGMIEAQQKSLSGSLLHLAMSYGT